MGCIRFRGFIRFIRLVNVKPFYKVYRVGGFCRVHKVCMDYWDYRVCHVERYLSGL